MPQELHDYDDEDEDDVDKGVWGASPIVDIQLSTSDLEEARLQKDGYEKVLSSGDIPANINDGSLMASPILLWYRRRSQGGSGVRLKPVVDIILSNKLVDSALVIAGYTCLNKSTNKGTITGKSQYLWVRRAFNTEEEEKDALVDIAVTKGNKKDLDNHIHKPPGRGFIQVSGKGKTGVQEIIHTTATRFARQSLTLRRGHEPFIHGLLLRQHLPLVSAHHPQVR